MAGVPGTLALCSLSAPTPVLSRFDPWPSRSGRRHREVVADGAHLAFRASDGPVAYRLEGVLGVNDLSNKNLILPDDL